MKKMLETGVQRFLRRLMGPGAEAFEADENWPVLFFVPDSAGEGGEEATIGRDAQPAFMRG